MAFLLPLQSSADGNGIVRVSNKTDSEIQFAFKARKYIWWSEKQKRNLTYTINPGQRIILRRGKFDEKAYSIWFKVCSELGCTPEPGKSWVSKWEKTKYLDVVIDGSFLPTMNDYFLTKASETSDKSISYKAHVFNVFCHFSKGDLREAIVAANRVISTMPKNGYGYVLLAELHLFNGNYIEAIETFNRGINAVSKTQKWAFIIYHNKALTKFKVSDPSYIDDLIKAYLIDDNLFEKHSKKMEYIEMPLSDIYELNPSEDSYKKVKDGQLKANQCSELIEDIKKYFEVANIN